MNIGYSIVTSGVACVFPSGLPIGRVLSVEKNSVKIQPFNNLDRIEYVRLVNYGLSGLISEDEINENGDLDGR